MYMTSHPYYIVTWDKSWVIHFHNIIVIVWCAEHIIHSVLPMTCKLHRILVNTPYTLEFT